MGGTSESEKNPAVLLKEQEPEVYYNVLDYIDRHKQELLEFYPEPFDGSARSLSASQLGVVRSSMESEKNEK